jgi:hypothetical protein
MLHDGATFRPGPAPGDIVVDVPQPPPEIWPDLLPLPTGLPPVAAFGPESLPQALRPWVMDIAERMQCPADFPAVAAMVCLGAVAGRQIGIRPKRQDDWLVVPNLWGAVIGRPSLLKSPALAEPMRFLTRLERQAREEHEAALQDHKARAIVAEEKVKLARRDVAKALKQGGGNALLHASDAMAGLDETPPARRRYVTNDGTVEKIGELLRDNPRGLLVFRDELTGWLQSLDREGREGARAFFLESWNGTGRFTFDRIGRGTVEIEAACVSVLGGVQPGPLSPYLGAALAGGAGDDGLVQRLQLLAWPDAPASWRNVDRWPDTPARQAAWEVFSRFDGFVGTSLGAFQENGDPIPWLRFDAAAQEEFDDWRETLEGRLRAGDLPAAVEAHLAKYRSLVPSLALLCHLVDHPEGGPVSHDALLRACAWAEYLETHACRLYAQALSPGMAAAVELSRRLPDLPDPFSARDVYRRDWRLLTLDGTAQALRVLVEYGHLREDDSAGPGRPTKLYHRHPDLLEGRQCATWIGSEIFRMPRVAHRQNPRNPKHSLILLVLSVPCLALSKKSRVKDRPPIPRPCPARPWRPAGKPCSPLSGSTPRCGTPSRPRRPTTARCGLHWASEGSAPAS